MKKIPLYARILIGMLIGGIFGIIAVYTNTGWIVDDWIKPFGVIFLKLLKLVAIPLIFASLITGISGLSDITKLSRIGFKTLLFYIFTTIVAVTIGLLFVTTFKPGQSFPEEKRIELLSKYSQVLETKTNVIEKTKSDGPLKFIVEIVPDNIVASASNNSNMLQIIFFAILFGVAIVVLKSPKVEIVRDFISGINDIILKIIDFIMYFAPIGVMALLAGLIVDYSGNNPSQSLKLFETLGYYALVVILGLLFLGFVIYPTFLRIFAKFPFKNFYKEMFPVHLVAFSTSSSAATLPVTMEQVEKGLGVRNEIASFVLPVGVTVNMDGTSLYQAVAAVFIAQVFGIEMTFFHFLTILFTATLASIGTAAVPGAGVVMLVIVLNAAGIPVEGLALILAIDRPLDMIRTVINVTSDAMIAVIIDRNEK
ncbi:MAG: dicarboxylate/amino acid:cation symporter [Ignavibacteria bacterium]|nr:dicarboxylate/amino acid:cation symporter [Ignavibacteria bacterium]